MIYTTSNIPQDTIKRFLSDCLNAGVKFDGTHDDKWSCFKVSRKGRKVSMNRLDRNEIYLRACENNSENAEGRKLGLI